MASKENRGKGRGGIPSESDIIKLVHSRRYRPMDVAEMASHLGVPSEDIPGLQETVRDLELAGEVVKVKKGRLAAPDKVDLIVGRLQCNPRGFAFVIPVRERDGEDLYVSSEDQGSALHGDLVAVSVVRQRPPRGSRGPRGPAGRVVSVVERAKETIVGTYRRDARFGFVVPEDQRLFRDVYVADADDGGARPGDKVVVRLTAWPRKGLNPEGAVEEVLGPEGDPRAQTLAVIREYDLREKFPPEVAKEAEDVPTRVSPADERGRTDLREALAFTVDPEDARDFDDAVSIETRRDGWELGVHIADVAHYVRPGSAIEEEARERGTSVYLPGTVLPMLPEALSNEMCSLREGRVRLTRSVFMRFDRQGELLDSRIEASFIRSCRRLNYNEVLAVFEGRASLGPEIDDALGHMKRLASVLRRNRAKRGMLVLDMPEPRIQCDEEGRAVGVETVRNDESHGMIEQFMLSANEVVAAFLAKKALPYVGRCHDEPDADSLAELREDLRALGYDLPMPGTRKQLQQVIDRASGKEEAYAVNVRILRAMKRADYRAEKKGHYAIAAPLYTHFTSPIRRFPDLLVHRILTDFDAGLLKDPQRVEEIKRGLDNVLRLASAAERRAEEAERDLTRRRQIELMIRDNDRPFDALVSRVDERGAVVTVIELGLEGRLGFRYLSNDFYRVDRGKARLVGRRGNRIRVGQRLKVRLAEADPDSGDAVLAPWSEAEIPSRRGGRPGGKGKKR